MDDGVYIMSIDKDLFKEDLQRIIYAIPGIETLSGKTVFIAGSTGQIGSALVTALLLYDKDDKNIRIIAHGRSIERLREYFGEQIPGKLEYAVGDVCNELELPDKIDYIIYSAGNSYPSAFRTDPTGIIRGSVYGVDRCLQYLCNNKYCRMLFISSGEVYSGGLRKEGKISEDDYGYLDILNPRSCYPMGKRAAETLCIAYKEQFGVYVNIVRPCHIFGPTSQEKDNSAASQFLRHAAKSEDIMLNSDGLTNRSYCYVPDCVGGILTVLLSGESGNAYNLSTDETITIGQFAEECAKESGNRVICNIPDEIESKEKSPINFQVMDNAKLKAFGWRPFFSIKDGIKHSVQIMRNTVDV